MFGKLSLTIGFFVTSFALSFGGIFFVKTTTFAQSYPLFSKETVISLPKEEAVEGPHVVVLLEEMRIDLRDGTSTVASYPVLSKGKPGSYFETIGGKHVSDYKTPLHFSSIGHVYMPYSIHVFGNYFIHGVPYYPSGEKVSSAYSGGCIRLSDEHAKAVYDFVTKGTPIIISQVTATEFSSTATTSSLVFSDDMTRLMVAAISLEALTQDNDIVDVTGSVVTRKGILPRLIQDNDKDVARTYANYLGEGAYLKLMEEKASALGLSNTTFTSVTAPAITSDVDLIRFYSYINNYKSYLRGLESTTTSSL